MNDEIKTKEEYTKIYRNRIDALVAKWENVEGYDGTEATYEFEETGTADEVIGFYIVCEGNKAFKRWRENIDGVVLTDQDKEVDRVLSLLYA